MRARDAMIPDPLVVQPATTLLEFVRLVLAGNQTTASVTEDGRLVGMVSVEDVFQRLLPHYVDMCGGLADVLRGDYFMESFARFQNLRVDAVMTRDVDHMAPDEPLMHAVHLFVERSRKTLPVIEDGQFLGSVTRRSVLRAAERQAKP